MKSAYFSFAVLVSVSVSGCSKSVPDVDIKKASDSQLIAVAQRYIGDCKDQLKVAVHPGATPEISRGEGVVGVYFPSIDGARKCVVYMEDSGTVEVNIFEPPEKGPE